MQPSKAQIVSTVLRIQLLPLTNREHPRSYSFLNHHKIIIISSRTLNVHVHAPKQTFPKSRALSGTKLSCGFLPPSTASNQVPQKKQFNHGEVQAWLKQPCWWYRHTRVLSTTGCPRGSTQRVSCTGLIDQISVIRDNFWSLQHRQVVLDPSPYSELWFH